MNKIIITILVLGLAATSSATIINIPADYPTIQQGIDASADGDTVLVQPGTYVENINFNGHNIVLGSLFLTTGDTSYMAETIIDGSNDVNAVTFENGENDTAALTGFTIAESNGYLSAGGGIFCYYASPLIGHNIIRDNIASGILAKGGGIFAVGGKPQILANIIMDNAAYGMLSGGGGIYCSSSEAIVISGNLIVSNVAYEGGGIYCCGSEISIIGNTISDNSGDYGGIICGQFDSLTLVNNIIWDNNSYSFPQVYAGSAIVSYSNIQAGWPGTGNIDIDPLFRDPANGDFHLMSIACGDSADSPCIDTGDPNILDSLLDCSWGLGGPRSDMGAYGGGDSLTTAIFDNLPSLPAQFILLQNYPNPFNAQTTIRFVLPESQNVQLTVYDLLGRRVEILLYEYRVAGVHAVTFDASNLSSGVYFYRLQVGDRIETKRMILLK